MKSKILHLLKWDLNVQWILRNFFCSNRFSEKEYLLSQFLKFRKSNDSEKNFQINDFDLKKWSIFDKSNNKLQNFEKDLKQNQNHTKTIYISI